MNTKKEQLEADLLAFTRSFVVRYTTESERSRIVKQRTRSWSEEEEEEKEEEEEEEEEERKDQ